MKIEDFVVKSRAGFGLCATTEIDGKEFCLSEQFDEDIFGVKDAVGMVADAMHKGGTIGVRYTLIQTMVEQEAAYAGMLVTGKGNGAIATIKREWGIKRNLRRTKVPVIMEMVLALGALLYEKRLANDFIDANV